MATDRLTGDIANYVSLLNKRILTRGGKQVLKFGDLADVNQTIDPTDLLNGKVLISGTDTTRDYIGSKVSAGTGIQFTVLNQDANESLQIATTGGTGIAELEMTEATGATGALVGKYYVANNVSLVVFTLPETAAFGDKIGFTGKGAGGWKILQNAGQTIHFGNQSTVTGVTGWVSSDHFQDGIILACITANTDWKVLWACGNIEMNIS